GTNHMIRDTMEKQPAPQEQNPPHPLDRNKDQKPDHERNTPLNRNLDNNPTQGITPMFSNSMLGKKPEQGPSAPINRDMDQKLAHGGNAPINRDKQELVDTPSKLYSHTMDQKPANRDQKPPTQEQRNRAKQAREHAANFANSMKDPKLVAKEKEVEQLRKEAQVKPISVSEASNDLLAFVAANEKEDPLVPGNHTPHNPYRSNDESGKKCTMM
ncbi:hypothetical protein PMAYCL1PPCAC_01001, partial [Pristionchus mayeri]